MSRTIDIAVAFAGVLGLIVLLCGVVAWSSSGFVLSQDPPTQTDLLTLGLTVLIGVYLYYMLDRNRARGELDKSLLLEQIKSAREALNQIEEVFQKYSKGLGDEALRDALLAHLKSLGVQITTIADVCQLCRVDLPALDGPIPITEYLLDLRRNATKSFPSPPSDQDANTAFLIIRHMRSSLLRALVESHRV